MSWNQIFQNNVVTIQVSQWIVGNLPYLVGQVGAQGQLPSAKHSWNPNCVCKGTGECLCCLEVISVGL